MEEYHYRCDGCRVSSCKCVIMVSDIGDMSRDVVEPDLPKLCPWGGIVPVWRKDGE